MQDFVFPRCPECGAFMNRCDSGDPGCLHCSDPTCIGSRVPGDPHNRVASIREPLPESARRRVMADRWRDFLLLGTLTVDERVGGDHCFRWRGTPDWQGQLERDASPMLILERWEAPQD